MWNFVVLCKFTSCQNLVRTEQFRDDVIQHDVLLPNSVTEREVKKLL